MFWEIRVSGLREKREVCREARRKGTEAEN